MKAVILDDDKVINSDCSHVIENKAVNEYNGLEWFSRWFLKMGKDEEGT